MGASSGEHALHCQTELRLVARSGSQQRIVPVVDGRPFRVCLVELAGPQGVHAVPVSAPGVEHAAPHVLVTSLP